MRLKSRLLALILVVVLADPAQSHGHSQPPPYRLHVFSLQTNQANLSYGPYLQTLPEVETEYDSVRFALNLGYFNPSNGSLVDLVVVNGKSEHDYLIKKGRPV